MLRSSASDYSVFPSLLMIQVDFENERFAALRIIAMPNLSRSAGVERRRQGTTMKENLANAQPCCSEALCVCYSHH